MIKRQIGPRIKYDSVIGDNVKIVGNVEFTSGLYVNGVIKGDISVDSEDSAVLTLDEGARVEGNVRAPQILLNGQVTGNVYALEHAELLPQARISGNLYYRSMQMTIGAEVNGKLVHTEDFNTL